MGRKRNATSLTPKGDPGAQLEQIAATRRLFNEAVVQPMAKAAGIQKRDGLKAAEILSQLPMQAASFGFHVEACHYITGWRITVSREIGGEMVALGNGKATSLYPALVQLSDGVLLKLAVMERSLYRDIKEAAA